jgi:hypothetical protein
MVCNKNKRTDPFTWFADLFSECLPSRKKRHNGIRCRLAKSVACLILALAAATTLQSADCRSYKKSLWGHYSASEIQSWWIASGVLSISRSRWKKAAPSSPSPSWSSSPLPSRSHGVQHQLREPPEFPQRVIGSGLISRCKNNCTVSFALFFFS